MTMTDKQYRAERASIEKMWRDYPGMTVTLIAELDAERTRANTPPTPAARPAPTTSPAPRPRARENDAMTDTEARIRRIVEDTGVSRKEAARRVAVADGTAPLVDMSKAELAELAASQHAAEYGHSDEPDERTAEQLLADLEAGAAEQSRQAREAREWGEGLQDRMEAARQAKAAHAKAERTRDDTIASIRANNPHLSAEEAGKYAPTVDALLGIAATQPKSGVAQAREDASAAWAVAHPTKAD